MLKEDADIVCLQETKLTKDLEDACAVDNYNMYWCHAVDKGYAGTAVFSREKPLNVTYGINTARFDTEGRIITAEYPEFFLVNAYIPNSGMKLERLKYKQEYDAAFLAYLKALEETKPVIVCGDLNVHFLLLCGFCVLHSLFLFCDVRCGPETRIVIGCAQGD